MRGWRAGCALAIVIALCASGAGMWIAVALHVIGA